MIAATVGTRERPCVCFVDAELEAFGCQNEVYLVVDLPIRPRQLVRVERVGKGESVIVCVLKESPSSVVCFSNAKSSYCLCSVLVSVRA